MVVARRGEGRGVLPVNRIRVVDLGALVVVAGVVVAGAGVGVEVAEQLRELGTKRPGRQALARSDDAGASHLFGPQPTRLRLEVIDDLLELRLHCRAGDVVVSRCRDCARGVGAHRVVQVVVEMREQRNELGPHRAG